MDSTTCAAMSQKLIDFILVSIRHEIRMGWGRSLDSREIKFIPFDDLGAVY